MNLFSLFPFGALSAEPIARDTLDNGLIVSTVDASDMGPETAIIDKNGAYPVERYETVELAVEGHAKWLEFCKAGNKVVKQEGYSPLRVDSKMITLEYPAEQKSQ